MKYFLSLILAAPGAMAQTYHPAPENLKAREWFQDSKFGLFIHWGVYSVLGKGEWVMNNDQIHSSRLRETAGALQPHRIQRG